MTSVRDRFPLKLTIGARDCTFLLAESFSFSNVDPGGFEAASFPIPHDLPWVVRGMNVRVDCGTQVAWEGRVKEVQRSLGNKTLIQCEGYKGLLTDNTLSMVYVDRDLTRWVGPTTSRTLFLTEKNYTQGSATVALDPVGGQPTIIQTIAGDWTAPYKPVVESWYDAGPANLIAKTYIALTSNPNEEAGTFIEQLAVIQDANHGTSESTVNLHPSNTGYYTWTKQSRFAVIQNIYETTPAGQAGAEFQALWKKLTMYGPHGLTLRGTDPGGFYTSDIVGHAVTQVTGLQAGTIPEATGLIVPQAAYHSPTPVEQVIADMAKLVGYHWGVWESPTYLAGSAEPRLDFRPYPQLGEPTAWVRRSECEQLDIREDLAGQYDTAQVTFTEAAGNEGVAEVTVANPILEAAGITGRTIQLSIGTSVQSAAEAYGRIALETMQLQARVLGTMAIKEPIHTLGGGDMAPWMLRAGLDRLRVPDLPSFDVWGVYNELPVKRVECSGSADGLTTTVEIGAGPSILEAITAQLQSATEVAQGR